MAFPRPPICSKIRLEPPPGADRQIACRYREALAVTDTALVGDIGLLGYRLVRSGAEVLLFPRACPHESASLDNSPCVATSLACQWHGRRIRPIGKFVWGEDSEFRKVPDRGTVQGGILTMEYDDRAAARAAATEEAAS